MVTSLPLEINKIFLTWTNRTPYSGRDGGRCRYIDVGFPLGFLLGEIPTGQSLWHLHPGTRITTPWAGPQELGCPVHITCSRMSHGSSSLNSPQEESWRQVIFNKIISIKRCNVQTPTWDQYKIQDKEFKENLAHNRKVEQQKFCVDFKCNSAHFALLWQTPFLANA